jgi:hypothetical protein
MERRLSPVKAGLFKCWLAQLGHNTAFDGCIETVAVDANGSAVGVEHKRNKNDNVINQSQSYFKWLKSLKSRFHFEKMMHPDFTNIDGRALICWALKDRHFAAVLARC